jgi:hypothetical protein
MPKFKEPYPTHDDPEFLNAATNLYAKKYPDFAARIAEVFPGSLNDVPSGIAADIAAVLWEEPVSFEDMIHLLGELLHAWMDHVEGVDWVDTDKSYTGARTLLRLILEQFTDYAFNCFHPGIDDRRQEGANLIRRS